MNIREHVLFDDCEKKVKELCYNRFQEECAELDDVGKQSAQDRFTKELETVENNGFYNEFYLMKLITEHAVQSKRLVVTGGQIAYSYIAYLMGVSDIDPVEMNYPMEMLYSIRLNKRPGISVWAPAGYSTSLIEYLGFLFGTDYVNANGKYVVLGDLSQQEKGYSKDTLDIAIHEIQIVTCADAILHEECDNDSYELFYKKRALIFKEKQSFQDIENGNVFFTCDDVYRYGQDLFKDRVLAFELMKNVRKGKGGSESVQRLLKEYGAGEDICEELKKIKHLCSEGTCLLEAQIIRYLMRKTVGIS